MEPSSTSRDSNQSIGQDHLAKEKKFEGFDILRAIFSIAIVAYKTNFFYVPEILVSNDLTYALSAYVFSGMVGALAVPVFLQISLFLFYYKSEKTGFSYFIRKRLPRLILLYLFWVGLITIFDIFFVGGLEAVKGAASSLKAFLEFIVSGNSTPYFFFFSLIFVTIIAEGLILLFNKLEKASTKITINYCLLIASSFLIFVFFTIELIIDRAVIQSSFLNYLNNIARWDYTPLNFLPYVFTTAITVQEYNEGRLEEVTKSLKRKLYSLLILTLGFFTLEWTLTSNGLLIQVDQAPLDHYLRLSLVFGSWLLLYLALLAKRKASTIVKFLSGCSLGIYGFHVFLIKKPLPFRNIPFLDNLFQTAPVLEAFTAFFVTLVGSVALTLLLKRIRILRRFA